MGRVAVGSPDNAEDGHLNRPTACSTASDLDVDDSTSAAAAKLIV